MLTLNHDKIRQELDLGSRIMSGRSLKRHLLAQLAQATTQLETRHHVRPCLAVVQVGDHPASSIYVRNKIASCKKTGVVSLLHHLPEDTSTEAFESLLSRLNDDDAVHGILVQLPLPAHLDPQQAITHISPGKDVDGFHPANLGELMAWRGTLEPCTPRGIMTMLRAYDVDVTGMHAVVIGRSMTVGRPMAQMLLRANATVTICHRHTRDLPAQVASADLLVVATGVPGLVRGDWIKPGAVVIDVGISRLPDGSLAGDVDFDAARQRAKYITPVPGGVGQMTVATLIENTVRAACRHAGVTIDLSTMASA